MKFTKITYISFLFGIILLSSCKKWLEVNPKTQTAAEVQFSTQQGFIDVLWGAYQKAVNANSYGRNMTFGLVDVLAQYYEGKSSTTDYYGFTARYNYTSTTPFDIPTTISNIWGNTYGVIAQANYILANIDNHTSVFTGNTYNLVKGESLALRSYMHFDLLRLFGPSYLTGSSAPSIPYMKDFTIKPQNKVSVSEVIDDCLADLREAKQLLQVDKSIDQIANNQTSTSSDLVNMYRQNHLNYWAVEAQMARIFLYAGNKDSAAFYAKDVIYSGKFNFVTQTAINNDPTSLNGDLTFSSEHIFSLYNSSMADISNTYFKTDAATADNGDFYSISTTLNNIYETSTVGYGTDVRSPNASKSLWNMISANLIYTKKYWVGNTSNVKEGLLPLLKLSEMYYIAAEASPTVEAGVGYLNIVRNARLLPSLATTLSQTSFDNELMKEYRKEFYGEGQLWYYYKRKNTTTIYNAPVSTALIPSNYIFPIPDNEIEFGL